MGDDAVRHILSNLSNSNLSKEIRLKVLNEGIELTEDPQKDTKMQVSFIQAGALHVLADFLREKDNKKDWRCTMQGLHFFRNLCRPENIWHEAVKKHRVISLILTDCARTFGDKPEVLEWMFRSLANMTFSDHANTQMMSMNMIGFLCQCLRKYWMRPEVAYGSMLLAANIAIDKKDEAITQMVKGGIVGSMVNILNITDATDMHIEVYGWCVEILGDVVACEETADVAVKAEGPKLAIQFLVRHVALAKWSEHERSVMAKGAAFMSKCFENLDKMGKHSNLICLDGGTILSEAMKKVTKRSSNDEDIQDDDLVYQVVRAIYGFTAKAKGNEAHRLRPAQRGFGSDGLVLSLYKAMDIAPKLSDRKYIESNAALALKNLLGA